MRSTKDFLFATVDHGLDETLLLALHTVPKYTATNLSRHPMIMSELRGSLESIRRVQGVVACSIVKMWQ